MNLFVVTGHTESGDELPVLAFHGKPDDARIEQAYRTMVPDEFEEGLSPPSWYVSQAIFA